jgi:hypothetical protein
VAGVVAKHTLLARSQDCFSPACWHRGDSAPSLAEFRVSSPEQRAASEKSQAEVRSSRLDTACAQTDSAIPRDHSRRSEDSPIRAVCGVARRAGCLIDDVQGGLRGVQARAVKYRRRKASESVVVLRGVIAGGVIRSAHEAARVICPGDARVRTRNAGDFVDYDAAKIPCYGDPGRVRGGAVSTSSARTAAAGQRKDISCYVAIGIETQAEDLLLDPATAMPEASESVGDRLELDRCSICH